MSQAHAVRAEAWRGIRQEPWRILRIADRPDLVPLVANWLWDAFWQPGGHRLEEVREILAAADAEIGTPQSFVLMAGEIPCGTASFMSADLEIRNDIGPWLAGLYVVPEARGQGCAQRLVTAVEEAARRSGEKALYLHTEDAQGLYEGLGWYAVGEGSDHGRPVTIMRRDL
ncbi:GNAT family N-acetyltransferase [Roseococcus sp. SYP-B2431]|uniref:GNAT family N-acetyltransferase n=1 Tax=Roseococcus sp. SYP-B2431 TaxID=2496640 RepID=UPI0013F4752F|nr:GNAT family N-acetyltransferase [Roseococcus sp. SYP-B2431]